ncbi:MAG: GGDEF domain-containing protein [Microthrixaceae bacterium]
MSPATLPAISHAVRRMTTIFSWAVLVIATATLVGWATSVVGLRTGRLFETPVAPNTAVSLVVLAFCVTRLQDLRPDATLRAVRTATCAVGLLSIATLVEYVAAVDLGIDHWFAAMFGHGDLSTRPSPHSAVTLMVLSAWVLSCTVDRRSARIGRSIAACASAFLIYQAGMGLILGVNYLAGIRDATGMAPVAFVMLSLLFGAMLSLPSGPLGDLLRSEGPGGRLLRTMVPAAVITVLTATAIADALADRDVIDGTDALYLVSGLTCVLLVGQLIWMAITSHHEFEDRLRLEDQLEKLALTDGQTGVMNRRAFEQALTRQLAVAARHPDYPVTVVLVDLDGLKRVNDSLGHSAGDVFIVGVADAMVGLSRTSDCVARIGGDEFALMLPSTTATGGFLVAQRLVDAVAGLALEGHGMTIGCSVSAGVASSIEGYLLAEDLLAAADWAMYRAKAAGGGRTRIAPAIGSTPSTAVEPAPFGGDTTITVSPALTRREPDATGGGARNVTTGTDEAPTVAAPVLGAPPLDTPTTEDVA